MIHFCLAKAPSPDKFMALFPSKLVWAAHRVFGQPVGEFIQWLRSQEASKVFAAAKKVKLPRHMAEKEEYFFEELQAWLGASQGSAFGTSGS